MSSDLRSLGARIRDQRERLGLRQSELAERARISGRYLRTIESGQYKPTRIVYQRIAAALGWTADEMDALTDEVSA